MLNNPMYPSYTGYNPMMNVQQRLTAMEQQYPQFANPNMGMGYSPQSNNFMKCRAVTSIDEAKASMIDLDGSVSVFTDLGNKRIYTKQINLDGTATLNTYILEEKSPAQSFTQEEIKNTADEKIAQLEMKIKDLEQSVLNLQKGVQNEYQSITDDADAQSDKQQPKSTSNASRNVRK